MNRFYCSLVFGLPAMLALACYPSAVRSDELADVSLTATTSGASTAVTPAANNCACAVCEGAGNCDGCCDRHWYAGVDALWLSPTSNQRTANYEMKTLGGSILNSWDASAANSADMVASPRVTLGLQGECWGIEARYWQMQDPVCCTQINPLDGTGFIADQGFRAETFDLEVTKQLCIGDTELVFAAGARYGQFDQSSGLQVNHLVGSDLYLGDVLVNRKFSGAGLTSAVTGVRPIGCCDSCFKLFYSARASLLFDGCATNRVDAYAIYEGTEAYNKGIEGSSENLFIGELEIGGQWDIPLKCIPANAYVRGAFEYQYWCTGNSGATGAISYAGNVLGPVGWATGASGGNSHVSLVGFMVGTGVTW